jgi:hypothetical protein
MKYVLKKTIPCSRAKHAIHAPYVEHARKYIKSFRYSLKITTLYVARHFVIKRRFEEFDDCFSIWPYISCRHQQELTQKTSCSGWT